MIYICIHMCAYLVIVRVLYRVMLWDIMLSYYLFALLKGIRCWYRCEMRYLMMVLVYGHTLNIRTKCNFSTVWRKSQWSFR